MTSANSKGSNDLNCSYLCNLAHVNIFVGKGSKSLGGKNDKIRKDTPPYHAVASELANESHLLAAES